MAAGLGLGGGLIGGTHGWQAAGFEVFSGISVPSKAFGEFVEHEFDTPRLTADQVKGMLDEGRDMVIVDSRPIGREWGCESIGFSLNNPFARAASTSSARWSTNYVEVEHYDSSGELRSVGHVNCALTDATFHRAGASTKVV